MVTAVSNFGAVTADRALRSRLFRVGVRLGAQLELVTYRLTFQLKQKQQKLAFVCSQTTITATSVVTAVSNFGAITADRALRSRLFRVGVGLGAQLKFIAYR